ncbi:STAS domain-containing protein [Peterkaempfera griseoplana]|uniref:STAS domain-containing protein n=1 Tax=Peterkaempfera griseoplana TaxID=66896 RepID=UPI0006E254CD|nr:hypothetical protein [Peterkaempfera griseoplana]
MALNGNEFRTAVAWWDGQATVAVTGEICLPTAPELASRVKECLARRPHRVDLDFAQCDFATARARTAWSGFIARRRRKAWS